MADLKNRHIKVLIPDGEKQLAIKVVHTLSKVKSVDIYLLSEHTWVELKFSRLIRKFSTYPEGLENRAKAEFIIDFAELHQIDVILPVHVGCEDLLGTYKGLFDQSKSRFLVPDCSNLSVSNCKWGLYQLLKDHNFDVPITYNQDQCKNGTLASINFPALLKPMEGMGGLGIQKIEDAEQLLAAINNTENSIVQEYLEGYDIDMSVLCKEGKILAYTIQKGFLSWNNPYQPFLGVEFIFEASIYDSIEKLMKLLNWSGVAHIDLRYDNKDGLFKIIEINPRFWGSLEASQKVGVNFPYLYCLAALGISFPKPTYQHEPFVNNRGYLKLLTRGKIPNKNMHHSLFGDILDPVPKTYKYLIKSLLKISPPKMRSYLKKFRYEVV